MEEKICKGCGAPLRANKEHCDYCGRENPFYGKQIAVAVEEKYDRLAMPESINPMSPNERRELFEIDPSVLRDYVDACSY